MSLLEDIAAKFRPVLSIVILFHLFVVHGRISVLNDLFVQLSSYSFVMCHVKFLSNKDGWMDGTLFLMC